MKLNAKILSFDSRVCYKKLNNGLILKVIEYRDYWFTGKFTVFSLRSKLIWF